MRVEEVRRKVKTEAEQEKKVKSVYGTTGMRWWSGRERGYFVRDPERNLVFYRLAGRDFEAEMYQEKREYPGIRIKMPVNAQK